MRSAWQMLSTKHPEVHEVGPADSVADALKPIPRHDAARY